MFRNYLRETRRVWIAHKELECMCDNYESECGNVKTRKLSDTELNKINQSKCDLKYFMENT